jgi:hypothetical protein
MGVWENWFAESSKGGETLQNTIDLKDSGTA